MMLGAFLLWKARLVSGGNRTYPRVYDPYEKSSPIIPLEVAKIQLGLASYHDAVVEVFDPSRIFECILEA